MSTIISRIFKNDSTEIAIADNSNAGENGANVCSSVFLDGDDTAVLKVYQGSGGNLTLYGGEGTCFFGGFRMTGGPTS